MFGVNFINDPVADGFIFFAFAVFYYNSLFLEANRKTLFRKLCASHFYTEDSIFTLNKITHFVGPPLPLYSELMGSVF